MSEAHHVTVKLDEQQMRSLLPRCDRCKWWSRISLYPLAPPDNYVRLSATEPTHLGNCHRLRVVGMTLAPAGEQPIMDLQPIPTTLEDFGCVLYEPLEVTP